jgi:hypothetical protein
MENILWLGLRRDFVLTRVISGGLYLAFNHLTSRKFDFKPDYSLKMQRVMLRASIDVERLALEATTYAPRFHKHS